MKNPKIPSQKYQHLMKILKFFANIVGGDVFVPNFRISMKASMALTAILFYYIFTTITIIRFFREDWRILLEACSMLGTVNICVTKLFTSFAKSQDFQDFDNNILNLYRIYEQKSDEYRNHLLKNCNGLNKVAIGLGIFFMFCFIGMVAQPLILLLWKGKRTLILHYHIPYLDVNTDFGYYTTTFIHGISNLMAGCGLFAGDNFSLIFLTQCFLYADVLHMKVRELNEVIADGVDEHNENQIQEALTDIIRWHQNYSEYTNRCNSVFYYIVTVQVGGSTIGLLLTIFIIITSFWAGAYFFATFSLYNICLYCIIGTKIEDCNDRFEYEIYNISWYNLPSKHQKMVLQMLMKSQTPAMIDIAGFLPLSVSTGLQILKTVYTVTMMILRFYSE